MTTQPESAPAAPKPTVLLLSLDKQPYFDEQYAQLIDSMADRATLKRASKPQQALTFLSSNTPDAIFATDPALTKAKFSAVLDSVKSYVVNGGTVVLAGHFSSFMKPLDIGRWFSTKWGLPWESGDYHRTTVHLNSQAQALPIQGLPSSYSQKAVFLKNVASNAAWYLPSTESRTESRVFAPASVDTQQTPVAFGAIGSGHLGYIGDVNGEEGSTAVVLAMCGLV
jgi:hypothetical protein